MHVHCHCPCADAVFLVGDFNRWSTTATPMRCLAGGRWQVTLPPGTTLGRHGFFVFSDGQPFGRMQRGSEQPEAVGRGPQPYAHAS